MKICILMPAHWSSRLGGAELQARFLLQHLRKSSAHDLAIICRHAKQEDDEGIKIHRITTAWPLARYTYLPDFPSVQYLLRKLSPDVIYSRVGSPLVGYAAHYCKRYGKALVHHIARRDDATPATHLKFRNVLRRTERRIYEWGLTQATAIIAQAQYQAVLLEKYFNYSNVKVIPNYHPLPVTIATKPSRSTLVLWVANIKAAKRPDAFVELARRCCDLADTRFVMVGALSDTAFSPLIKLAKSLHNFSYVGQLSLEHVNDLMKDAQVVVNTSSEFGEGFPNTFIQAWLHGAPVVSLEVNPDSLLSGGSLGVCAGGSVDQLESQLRSLLRDRDRLAQMGRTARLYAENAYGFRNLKAIQVLLEDCANGTSH